MSSHFKYFCSQIRCREWELNTSKKAKWEAGPLIWTVISSQKLCLSDDYIVVSIPKVSEQFLLIKPIFLLVLYGIHFDSFYRETKIITSMKNFSFIFVLCRIECFWNFSPFFKFSPCMWDVAWASVFYITLNILLSNKI